MNEKTQKLYSEQFKALPDQALINQLREGKEAFREGVYEFLVKEAAERGLSGSHLDEQIHTAEVDDLEKGINAWIIWGYVLLGIPGFFLGLKLIKAARGADAEIRSKARANGIILMIIGGLFLAVVVIGIIAALVQRITG